MNSITVSLQRNDDETAEMVVEIAAGQFCGRGSAWFSLEGISQNLSLFEAFPIDDNDAPKIVGGHWNDDASILVREYVHIAVTPLDKLGNLVMTVKAFTPSVGHFGNGLGQGVHCDCFLSYEGLVDFCQKMRALISGEVSRIEFDAFATQ